MLITVQATPNHNSMKYIVPKQWINFVWECCNEIDAKKSDLAQKLWEIDGIIYLMFGNDFVAINKLSEFSWQNLTPIILDVISEFLVQDRSLFSEIIPKEDQKEFNELDLKIISVLNAKVMPALAEHGGRVKFVRFDGATLFLELQGACKGCPSSAYTMQEGIFNLLQYYFPEIKKVEGI